MSVKLGICKMKVKALVEYLMFCEAANEVPRKDITLLMFACEDYNTLVQIFETHKKAHDQFIKKK